MTDKDEDWKGISKIRDISKKERGHIARSTAANIAATNATRAGTNPSKIRTPFARAVTATFKGHSRHE